MMPLQRGMIVDVELNPVKGSETGKKRPCVIVTNDTYNERLSVVQVTPLTEWNPNKERIITNVTLHPTSETGLTKKSVADCLQTRPIDRRQRLSQVRGRVSREDLNRIDAALRAVFGI